MGYVAHMYTGNKGVYSLMYVCRKCDFVSDICCIGVVGSYIILDNANKCSIGYFISLTNLS